MLPTESLLAFLAVSLLVTLAPGPDNLMVLGQSLARGRRAGLGLAMGCALGCFTHTLWATLGTSAFLLASPTAFLLFKLAGAAYLSWLGLQLLRGSLRGRAEKPVQVIAVQANPNTDTDTNVHPVEFSQAPSAKLRPYLVRGFIANAINPKVALFFLAFLPQFVRPDLGSGAVQMVVLGALFALQTVAVFGLIAYAAGSLGQVLAARPRIALWLDRLAGSLFLGLAAHLLFSQGRPQ